MMPNEHKRKGTLLANTLRMKEAAAIIAPEKMTIRNPKALVSALEMGPKRCRKNFQKINSEKREITQGNEAALNLAHQMVSGTS
jgi:hypothetical protein